MEMRRIAGGVAATFVLFLVLGVRPLSDSPRMAGVLGVPLLPQPSAGSPTPAPQPSKGVQPLSVAPSHRVPPGPSSGRAPYILVVSGIASYYTWPGRTQFLALPEPYGRGHTVRICGPATCLVRTSNDVGPVRRLHRVADLDPQDFQAVCGCSLGRGLVHVTIEFLS